MVNEDADRILISCFRNYSISYLFENIIHFEKVNQMGVIREVNVTITGQVPDDWSDKDYEVCIAKLKVICAEYGLDIQGE
jgi:hypothetical protein